MARNGTEKSTLTPKQQRLVIALLSGMTNERAAIECKISLRTVARWKKQKPFQDESNRVARAAYRDSMDVLAATCVEAVTTLRETLGSVLATDAVKIRAAKIILETATQFINPGAGEVADAIPIAKFLGGDVMDDTDFDLEDSA